ncbi:hypothetical protein HZA56_05930 [Candidatus Poribacteria bacterium]|nr:hypothetical protein [Candidatus Poribacteria bacterium]
MVSEPIRIVGQTLFVLLCLLLPYFHLLRWKRLSAEEAIVLSFGVSSLIFGFAAFFTHAFGLPQKSIHWLFLAMFAASVTPFLRRGLGALKGASLSPFGFLAAFLLLIMALEASFPIYIGGFWYFDWWQHYSVSQMYMGKVAHDYLWLGMYNFASRTPLMNLDAAFFLSVFGDNYWMYQIVSSILNSIYILPAFLLCRRVSGKKTTVMIVSLLFLSPSLVHNAWYPWPKLFAAYFALLAAYFYLKRRQASSIPDNIDCVLVFALIWAGFFAHQSSLFSSVVILVDLFLRALRKEPKRVLLLGAACALCFIVINGIWFAWATSFFGIRRSFLSYYERPATVGGLSGYLILFTYHTLATICSPLFVYDLAGKQFDAMRFFENIQVLYYNSFAGMATVTVFVGSAAVLFARLSSRDQIGAGYADFAASQTVKWLLWIMGGWALVIGVLILAVPGFGAALFSRFFNHPDFARRMFAWLFLAAGSAIAGAGVLLWRLGRGRAGAAGSTETDSASNLLFWMAVTGYAGGIATHHELYIHGMVSAGCATSVLLTAIFLARACSDFSRITRLILAIPILCENVLITWLPLLIIKYNWGWADEKNRLLKAESSAVFLADLLPGAWAALAVVGLMIQVVMMAVWIAGFDGGRIERSLSYSHNADILRKD